MVMLEWAVASGVLILLVLLIRQLFKGRLSPVLQYGLWLPVLIRLLVPVNLIDTDLSVLNLLARWEGGGQTAGRTAEQIVDLGADSALAAGLTGLWQKGPGAVPELLPGTVLEPESPVKGEQGEGTQGSAAGEQVPGYSVDGGEGNVPYSGGEGEGNLPYSGDGEGNVLYSGEENRGESQMGADTGENAAAAAGGSVSARWSGVLWAVWMAGMILTAGVLAGMNLHFYRRLLRARRPLEDRGGKMPEERQDPGRRMAAGGKAGPAVYRVRKLSGPCLFGLIHPAIYLPEGITEEQLPYVLAHEESHYRAGDHVWALLRSLCLVLHWYNPLVWLAALMSRRDGELACDARAVRRLGEERRNAYGRMLVDLTVQKMSAVEFLCCAADMTADGRRLKERVERIAHKPRWSALAAELAVDLMIIVSCVACTGAKDTSAVDPGAAAAGAMNGVLNSALQEAMTIEHDKLLNELLEEREARLEEALNAAQNEALKEEWKAGENGDTYYRVVESAEIADSWFTMEVPESLVGQVGYGVTLGQNEAGEKYLQALDFFHITSLEAGMPEEESGQDRWQNYGSGWLCGYSWTGYPDIAADLEEIAYRSGTRDIRGMDFLLSRDYDGYAGVSGRLVQANNAGTGAYFYTEPTDVQWTEETREEYLACAEELAAYGDRFAARSFPYEELEGYFEEPSAGMPRWRQDFEEAEQIYAWFTSAVQAPVKSMRNDGGDYGVYTTPEGRIYAEADVPGVNDMEDFRRYLGRWFEPELVEDLLSGRKPSLEQSPGAFTEVDGKLYALVGWISELQSAPRERQYAAYFTELTDTGQERPIGMYAENGGRRRAQIYTNCRYNDDSDSPIAILCYTMEEQEDGSWRIVEDYELATLQLLSTLQE